MADEQEPEVSQDSLTILTEDNNGTDSKIQCSSSINEDRMEGFLDKITHLTDHDRVISIRQEQIAMLRDFEIANSRLASLNEISENTFNNSVADFKQYTKSLHDMKKQLDSIFRRIRTLKVKAAIAYPEAYRLAEEKSTLRLEKELSPDD